MFKIHSDCGHAVNTFGASLRMRELVASQLQLPPISTAHLHLVASQDAHLSSLITLN
jgi:hypothetical protein